MMEEQLYGYVNYGISNPSKKMRKTDTQFKVNKQNSKLDPFATFWSKG